MGLLGLSRMSDEHLGRRLAEGEAAAFDELYRRYVHRLAAYGAHLLGDASAGDDVSQSTLLKAYGALRDGRVPDRVKPWLYRIAHNTAVTLVVRRRELPSEALPEQVSEADSTTTGALVAALAALPERQRHVYVLREVHGLRIGETAAALGLAPEQVEQALFAARNRLAEHLVFGDRLSCVSVQRLAAGPLDSDERRALKTHLRSCPACRQSVGAKAGALGLVPSAAAEWLRSLPGLLIGGAAPVTAKLGATVAAATLVTGAPIAYEVAKDRNPRPVAAVAVLHRVKQRIQHVSEHVRSAVPAARSVVLPVTSVSKAESPIERSSAGTSRDRSGSKLADSHAQTRGSGDGGDGSRDSSGKDSGTATIPAAAPIAVAAPTTDGGGDPGTPSSPGGGSDGGSSPDSSSSDGHGSGDGSDTSG